MQVAVLCASTIYSFDWPCGARFYRALGHHTFVKMVILVMRWIPLCGVSPCVEILLKRTVLLKKGPAAVGQELRIRPVDARLAVYDVFYDFVIRHSSSRVTDGLAKFMRVWFSHILRQGGHSRRLWLFISYAIEQRQFRANHTSPFIRYRKYFPAQYTHHVHLLEALYVAMVYKNLLPFTQYLKKMFEAVNFFKHKYLLYFLRAIFNGFKRHANSPIRGLFVKFRGKLAQAGNSRRKRFLVGCGQVSTSYGSLYKIEKFQIKTFTGAIGCTVILSF